MENDIKTVEDRDPKNYIWIIVGVGILIAGFLMYFFGGNSNVVATVNGEEITKDLVSSRVESAKILLQSQGASVGNEQALMNQALEQVIDETLIIQKAKEDGISASQEEVDEQYDILVQEFGSKAQLKKEMRNRGISSGEIKDEIAKYIIVEKYLNKETSGIEVSEEEVKNYYETLTQSNENSPDYENVKESLKNTLLQRKIQKEIASILETLRQKAEINII